MPRAAGGAPRGERVSQTRAAPHQRRVTVRLAALRSPHVVRARKGKRRGPRAVTSGQRSVGCLTRESRDRSACNGRIACDARGAPAPVSCSRTPRGRPAPVRPGDLVSRYKRTKLKVARRTCNRGRPTMRRFACFTILLAFASLLLVAGAQ